MVEKLNKNQIKFIKDILNKMVNDLVFNDKCSVSGACKLLAVEVGVSFVTLYNIYTDRSLCSAKTAKFMIKAGWFSSEELNAPVKTSTSNKSSKKKVAKKNTSTKQRIEEDKNYSKGYSKGYDQGLIDGDDIGYKAGLKDGRKNGYSDGYIAGYNNGFDDGKLKTNKSSRTSYTGTSIKNTPRYSKLKKLVALKVGTTYSNEANNAGLAASNILTEILSEHPDFKELNLKININ